MSKNKYSVEPISEEELLREAEIIEKEMAEVELVEVPEGAKERVKAKLQAQIEEYEREKILAQLSEEDKKALELGRELLRKEEENVYVYRKKKPLRVYIALAAVLVMVLAMGITSVGGPEKVLQIVKSMVGEREVKQVDTGEDNYIIEEESEEEAYQDVRDAFKVEPVKILWRPKEMQFISMVLDEDLQMAELLYEYEEERMVCFISTSYLQGSWGIDVEDTLTDEYSFEREILTGEEICIEVKEYETPESRTKRYSASFEYKDLEYFYIATMDKNNFENILNNLFFSR